MFERFYGWRFILLVGPHRAGTTIAARMIASDLDLEYYEEEDVFHWAETSHLDQIDIRAWLAHVGAPRLVLRGPALSSRAHTWALSVDEMCVVMLLRPVDDILASQRRVRWAMERPELSWYPANYREEGLHACQAKYRYWSEVQQPMLGDQAYELWYEDLSKHELWVPKEERGDFWSRQWRPGEKKGQRWMMREEEYDARYQPALGVVEEPGSPRVRRMRS